MTLAVYTTETGEDFFHEVISYVEKHKLYSDALIIWRDNPTHYKVRYPGWSMWTNLSGLFRQRVLEVYGEYLFERRDFRQAALGELSLSFLLDQYSPPPPIVFIDAQLPRKALVAFERALLWRDLFDLALREKLDEDEIQDMAYRIAGMYS